MNGKIITDDKIREILASGEYRSQIAIEPETDTHFASGHLAFSTLERDEFGWFALELFTPRATAEELFKSGMNALVEIRRDPRVFFLIQDYQDSLIP